MNFNEYVKNIYTKNSLNEGPGNYAYDVFTNRYPVIDIETACMDYDEETGEEYYNEELAEDYYQSIKTEIITQLNAEPGLSTSVLPSNQPEIFIVGKSITGNQFPVFVKSGLQFDDFDMDIQLTVRCEQHYSNNVYIDGEIEYYSEYYNNGNFNADKIQDFVEDVVAYAIENSNVEYDEDEIKEFENEMISTIQKVKDKLVDQVEEIISDTIKRLS